MIPAYDLFPRLAPTPTDEEELSSQQTTSN